MRLPKTEGKMKGCKRRAVLLMTVLLSGVLSGSEVGGPWRQDRPLTVGHRGTTVLAEENTLSAYAAAWREGVDVIECDPRLTKDGVYIIMHDPTVDRTTDGRGLVRNLTLAQIKQLKTRSGEPVPTLQEVLDFARGHDLGVYLDVKEVPPDGAELLVKQIEAAGMVERVIVGCYHVKTMQMVEARRPDLSTCLSWPYPLAGLNQIKKLGADAAATLVQLATPAMIRNAHRLGLKVITMPINDPAQLAEMKQRGLDALQSDDPRLLRPYGKTPDSSAEPLP